MKETKFKNTEIGRIPEEWETCTILSQSNKLVVAFVGTCEKYYTNKGEGVMMLRTGDLKERSIDYTNIKYISYSFHNANKKSQLKKGDILIARHGSNGHGVIYDKNDEANSLNFVIVHLIDNEYLNSYLVCCLDTNIVREQIEAATAGSTQKVINTKAIGELIVPKPNILEQQRIASALTSIDNLISSLGKLIEKKKNIKQGTMQQLLTGQIRLKGFSEPWGEKKLEEVCSVKRGVRVVKRNLTTDGLYPVYQNTNFPLGYSNQYNVEANTPFVIIGGSAGQVGICRERYWAADDCAFFACHDIYKEYLYYVLLLNQRNILHNVRTGTIPRLDRTFLSGMLVYISSNIAEQQAIATILTKMDDEITALEAKKAKYEAIKQGMMQQLLTGKIRLIS